jgi:Gluconate 2-dehydrogenase subunit 3
MMNRREALARMVAITGTMAIGAEFFLTGCQRPEAKKRTEALTTTDVALLDEIGETIIPATTTPGAKAAGVGPFMAMIARDCYDDASYASFRGGLAKIDDACQKKHGTSFVAASPSDRTALLNELDREQRTYTKDKKRTDPPHYFKLMKELTLLGFFSSEVGATKAMRYIESPGSYDGNVAYKKGDRAWYNPSRRIS